MEKVIRTDPNDSNSASTAPGGPHPTRRGRLHPRLGPSPPSGALRGLSGATSERPWKEGSTRAKPRRRPSAPRWRPPRPRRPRGRWSAAARAPICTRGATRAAAARERWVGRARVQPGGEAETGHHAGGAAGRVWRSGSMCSVAAARAPPPTEDVNWPRARPSTPLLVQVGHVRTAAVVKRSEAEVHDGFCGGARVVHMRGDVCACVEVTVCEVSQRTRHAEHAAQAHGRQASGREGGARSGACTSSI